MLPVPVELVYELPIPVEEVIRRATIWPDTDSFTARRRLRPYHRRMLLTLTQAGLLAAELEARGFLAGVGKFILFVIIFLVVIGGLIGFTVARRTGGRR